MKAYGVWGICPGEELLRRFEGKVVDIVGSRGKCFEHMQLANVMWSYAALGIRPKERILWVLGEMVASTARNFTAIDVSNVMWAYAKMEIFPEAELIVVLEAQTLKLSSMKYSDFTCWSASKILWAYGTWGKKPPTELVERLEAQICLRINEFIPQDIADTMWAYATLGMAPGEEFMGKVEGRAASMGLQRFMRNDVSKLLWAYAVMNACPGQELLSRLLCNAVEKLRKEKDSSGDVEGEDEELCIFQLKHFVLSYQQRGWGEGRDNSLFTSLKNELECKEAAQDETDQRMAGEQQQAQGHDFNDENLPGVCAHLCVFICACVLVCLFASVFLPVCILFIHLCR
jgi:hypothetical protein